MNTSKRTVLAALFLLAIAALVVASPAPNAAVATDSAGITEENFMEKVGAASTKADHEALAAYFRAEAKAKAESVARHEAMFKSWRNVQGKPKGHMRAHCETLLNTYAAQQKALEALAEDHEKLAK